VSDSPLCYVRMPFRMYADTQCVLFQRAYTTGGLKTPMSARDKTRASSRVSLNPCSFVPYARHQGNAMTDIPTATILPMKSAKAKPDNRRTSERKFGKPVMDLGFCIVPSLLMQAQARLGINSAQFNIIMHLADIWWDHERKPFPSKKLLADRIGLSERQIQRHIAELELSGIVTRIGRTRPGRGKVSNEYDLAGLVSRLKALEPEFKNMQDENRQRRKNVALPQHRRKA